MLKYASLKIYYRNLVDRVSTLANLGLQTQVIPL